MGTETAAEADLAVVGAAEADLAVVGAETAEVIDRL
jgi:hypothetical protein